MPREQRLTRAFVELADISAEGFDVVEFLRILLERCIELVDADAAGLLLADQHGGPQVIAFSCEPARLLQLGQLQNDQGPCLECFSTGRAILNVDLVATRGRWPAFTEAATAAGFTVSHALPLRLRGEVIGAMNLFSAERVKLSENDLAVAQGLADVATIGLLHERAVRQRAVLSEQLQSALHSRVLIEQAKGALSVYAGVSVSDAFTLMRTHARRSGRPLSFVAQAVVDGSIDPRTLQQTLQRLGPVEARSGLADLAGSA